MRIVWAKPTLAVIRSFSGAFIGFPVSRSKGVVIDDLYGPQPNEDLEMWSSEKYKRATFSEMEIRSLDWKTTNGVQDILDEDERVPNL